MTVEQDRIAVTGSDALDLRGELRVIRSKILGPPRRDLARIRAAAGVERVVAERARRAELGVVGARIERRSGRIAVEIDDIA